MDYGGRLFPQAEIVTTFPLDQAAHYRKKKYKDDREC